MPPVLEVNHIKVRYSGLPVVHDISLSVNAGQTVCVVGANGSGKSTLLRAIMGSRRIFHGEILFKGQPIHHLSTEAIVRKGIVYVPEEKMLFKPLSVADNLLLGAYTLKDAKRIDENLAYVYAMFPRLKERSNQAVSTLSGGEQQMVAVGRGLMSNPQILMLDEPSLGLSPLLVNNIFAILHQINQEGMTILLVEQNVHHSLKLAQRAYVLENGELVKEGLSQDLLQDDKVCKAYLGF
jgi:branched-chain amino acid transport system ATP-binding protein